MCQSASARVPYAIRPVPECHVPERCVPECHATGCHVPECHVPHCLAASLPCCLTASLPCCFAASLPCCLNALLPRCLAALLPHCLAASLPCCLAALLLCCFSPHAPVVARYGGRQRGGHAVDRHVCSPSIAVAVSATVALTYAAPHRTMRCDDERPGHPGACAAACPIGNHRPF